jgi:Flp pilus assembly protein TadG
VGHAGVERRRLAQERVGEQRERQDRGVIVSGYRGGPFLRGINDSEGVRGVGRVRVSSDRSTCVKMGAEMGRGARWLRDFRGMLADRRGNAAMMFGLAVLPLMGATGLAVDTARAYNIEDQLQKSLDAAALAAGRSLDSANVEDDARSFLLANLEGTVELDDFDIDTSADGKRITITATAEMPTSFMRVVGFDAMTVRARTVINREVRKMELALVLDNTGSMWGTPFQTMQAAAKDLVNSVYGDQETHPNLWVSVVPFASTVNVGSGRTSWLSTADPVRAGGNPYHPSSWKGCVLARTDGADETDDPPAEKPFRSFLYPDAVDNDWGAPRNPATNESLAARNEAYGPNLGCGPPILPLTAEKTTVLAALDGMGAWSRGGTAGNEGLAWGWRVLSPRWRGLWGGSTPSDMPLDYGTSQAEKVIVLLTDGNNEVHDWSNGWLSNRNGKTDWCGEDKKKFDGKDCPLGTRDDQFWAPGGSDYTAFGRLWDFAGNGARISHGKTILDQKMTRLCAAVKNRGMTVYTITFGNTPSASTKTLYQNCATTSEHYFHAPDNATLRTVFKQVSLQLSSLRIAE